ncbi:alpha/beta fold hydrolase [Arthrobacter sp. NPDC056886]|uniref:alpha/beta fold hydrolase n=1 Tax=Arthrobacter sp. NPDC056886 TaxID=3345960 RepID=UPI00366EABA5
MSDCLPTVFVHGLFGPFSEWETFAQLEPALCTAPDLDGYGPETDRPVTLAGQVASLRAHVEKEHGDGPVHLVGHSIGSVYAFTLANQSPWLVASVTSVEGNFSLADAFWSRSIAVMSEDEARLSIESRLSDPVGFLTGDDIAVAGEYLARAREALAYQPWPTIWESAKAIVGATSGPDYEELLRSVFASMPVHLVAGQRSSKDWHVPGWAREQAATFTTLAVAGHMMMLEQPARFGRALAAALGAVTH